MNTLSARLRAVLEGLALRPGLRVLEVGCGPGALAVAMAREVSPGGFVLGIDRSASALAKASAAASRSVADGTLALRCCAAEDFVLAPDERPFDVIVAVRVGAFDGRHPTTGAVARRRMAAALRPGGRFVVDGVLQVTDG
jgi:cyclopropane fatty-acyl-phospholipid synthase-like methyltransferase